MNAPMPKPTVDLDSYYQSRPDTRPDLLHPVYGRHGTIAWFPDYYAAVDFVNADKRTLFIGEPEYSALKHNRRVA